MSSLIKYLALFIALALPATASASFQRDYCPRRITPPLRTDNITFQKVLEIDPITPGFAILEGPIWVDDALLLSHIGYPIDDNASPADLGVFRDGQYTVLQAGYGANGMTFDPKGFVVAARQKDGTVTRVINGKKLVEQFDGARFNSPNDLVFSSRGDLYFSDPDYQVPLPIPQAAERVYHVSRTGQVRPFGAIIEKPNGVMLSRNERTLYVGGVNGLFAFRVRLNGEIVDVAEPVQPTVITGGVDGLGKDCAGNLWVAANGQVVVLSRGHGRVLATFAIDGATNIAFGGSDGRTVFVTTLGARPQVWQARSNVPGFPF